MPPELHAAHPDRPQTEERIHTLCGLFVSTLDIAENVEDVTCLVCLALLMVKN